MVEEAYVIVPLMEKVKQWHHDRNLIEGATDKDQYMKLIQEAGELSDNICKGNDIRDDIGDMLVVLINIAERNGLSLTDCLSVAWNDIKDRKGRMVDGVFVKESDGYAIEDFDMTKVTIIEHNPQVPHTIDEPPVVDRRATGSLDGPGFDWSLDGSPDEGLEESTAPKYKNTAFGTTKY